MLLQIDDLPELVDFDTLAARFVPVSRPTLWRWEQAGTFPKRTRIGGRNFWRKADLITWISEKAEKSNAQ